MLSVSIVTAFTGVSLGSDNAWSQPVRVFEQEIVRQQGDYDCGPAAALATLIAAQSGAVPELTGLMARFSADALEFPRIRSEGFSLEQLARLAQDVGANPQIVRVSAASLSTYRGCRCWCTYSYPRARISVY